MDGSGRILDRMRKEHNFLRVIHQLNLGHDAAVRRGYEMAKGTYVVQIDGNGRYEPGEFAEIWTKRSDYRLILGQRAHRLDRFIHRLLSHAMRRVLHFFFHIDFNDPNAPFRMMQRETAVTCLQRIPATVRSVDLMLTVLLAQEHPSEVCEILVPYRLRTLGARRANAVELITRAVHTFGELFRLRFRRASTGIPSISPRTASARG
jgi:hypothetical protein